MAQLNTIQTNFTAGEVSPVMHGRVDLAKYANGAKTLQNMVVKPQGSAYRRSGSKYLGSTKSDLAAVLIPFSFNTQQNYVLELTNLKMRIWKNDALLGSPDEITTPWATADLSELRWCQSADTIFVVHPRYSPRVITRDYNEDFTVEEYVFIDGPYKGIDEPEPIYLSSYSHVGTCVVTTGAGIFTNPTDVGKYVEFRKDGLWQLLLITAVVSTTEVDGTVVETLLTDFDARTRIKVKGGATQVAQTPGDGSATPVLNNANIRFAGARYVPAAANTSASAAGAGATITSSFSGTFTRQDVGKHIRMNSGAHAGKWYKITAFTNSTTVTANVLTMVTYTYPTTIVDLTEESRTVSGLVKSGGYFFDTGEDYFLESSQPYAGFIGDFPFVGRHIRFNFGGTTCWGRITAVTDNNGLFNNGITIAMEENIPYDINDPSVLFADGIPDSWRLGAWCGAFDSGRFYGTGFPSYVTFHEQRLVFANIFEEPQSVWMSRPNDYGNFSPTERDSSVLDDNAISYTIVSRQVNAIIWMESGPVLLIGTTGGEWQVKAASNIAAPLSPSNISVTPQSNIGSISTSIGRRVNSATLFIDKTGRRVRHMQYNFELDQHVTRDLTIVADHILELSGAKGTKAVFLQSPDNLYWVLKSDGTLACLTYEPDQEVYAWSRHVLGGSGVIEDITTIPSSDGTEDYLYMVVRRTIDGGTKRYLERLEAVFRPSSETATTEQAFLDCAAVWTGALTNLITGFIHLKGEQVRVLGDGSDLGNATVSATGTITLSVSVTHARVGYQSNAIVEVLRPEAPTPQGTSQGKMKRVHKLVIRVKDTGDFSVGKDSDTTNEMKSYVDTGLESSAVLMKLKTRDVVATPTIEWNMASTYLAIQTRPYNLHVVAFMPIVTTNE